MGERYLTMLEVSQKQAYIFSSNKLKDNIVNSSVIAWMMDPEYLKQIHTQGCGIYLQIYCRSVYANGHTDTQTAKSC